ncbi:MAG: phenylalanine--tRNA ligase subunit alpha [Bacteroidetes bacterium]|nr:MAG: phenylalanine--tRNA ligase subunit alpha [Bacteroidota bacterium]REK31948.1 MAG: phenylalanine--tRNA ligase subunit alpha [Bacteroidota bacterium]REK50013.1 MAG: phenylalanine--tRNA ligase subunit alpha [Bacteroidota bacterium]
MQEKIRPYIEEVEKFNAATREELDGFRIKFLSKKGILAELFSGMKDIQADQRKEYGQMVNELKNKAEEKLSQLQTQIENAQDSRQAHDLDLTLPAEPIYPGSRHPISITKNKIIEIFSRIGFTVADGPEIEDDWHNFTALNFPENHPARDMQDTFFIEQKGPDSIALRTHTSSVQVRVMENNKPPIRVLSPGRVYRNEAISARAHCFFHQVEGLYIDEGVSFADMKQTLLYFAREMFGSGTRIRLRPSYFPFTEPSAEMDVTCSICKGKGCNVCKYSGWLEIMGCGMVDPNVLENCGIDPEKYTGYAFGMGIERIAMLLHNVKDLRLFSENDVRFLKQFAAE